MTEKGLNRAIFAGIFLITQITGVLLSLAICYVLADFIRGFMIMAIINSFFLGVSLVSCSFITRELMFRMHTVYLLAISLTIILGTAIASFLFLLFSHPTLFIYYARGAYAFLFINLLFIMAFYVITSGLTVYREIVAQKESAIHEERLLKKRMEMKMLVSRVNPHFLFNTLNMLLNLLKKPALAEEALLNLSDLLRNNLSYSDKETISLAEELTNVKNYLAIQKLRFEGRLHYDIAGGSSASVPPLIVQPLVENSIKHNLDHLEHLKITIAVEESDEETILRVVDSERLLEPSMLNRGTGLTITKQRVEISGGTFELVDGGVEIRFGKH